MITKNPAFFLTGTDLTNRLFKNGFFGKSLFGSTLKSRIIFTKVFRMNSHSRSASASQNVSRWFLLLPLFSSIFYVISYVCMRQLAQTQADVVLSVGIREGITGLGGAFVFAWLFGTGRVPFPKLKYLLAFTCTSLALQLLGNIYQQQSFEVIGMGMTTASCWTGQLLLTPILGWFILREKLTFPLLLSLLLAFAALLFLTSGAEVQNSSPTSILNTAVADSTSTADSTGMTTTAELTDRPQIGKQTENRHSTETKTDDTSAKKDFPKRFTAIKFVLLSAAAGFIMAASNCVIRWMNQAGNSPFFAVMFLPGIGGVFLLGGDLLTNGTATWQAFSSGDFLYSALAGLTNMTAFVVLTFSLRFLSSVRVCVIMISQLALAPLAGCLIFREPLNAVILLGILMVIAGILVSALSPQKE